jgi:2-amino-4-hydroxy-6-hydroxymethyldihydropteridine diphosphokinase
MSDSARAFIGLGGNLGEPREAMRTALHRLDADYDTDVLAVSSLYRTPPWGRTDQPDFLNAVAEIETRREPAALLDLCLRIEADLHRVRDEHWGPRSIDLDVLVYGDTVLSTPQLTLPHPRMLQRAFVLAPLAEIAPNLRVADLPVTEWLSLVDTSGISIEEDARWCGLGR